MVEYLKMVWEGGWAFWLVNGVVAWIALGITKLVFLDLPGTSGLRVIENAFGKNSQHWHWNTQRCRNQCPSPNSTTSI
jgi:hypothetical protein